jgi:hypothetical protein
LYYVLEENKSQLVGGTDGVDIFSLSIDREQDMVEFCIENLVFNDLHDDYSPKLLEIFNMLFGKSGEDIYHYLMEFYRQPTDGLTNRTQIDGMQITYKCTPKHKLLISLKYESSNKEIDNGQ